MFEKTWRRERLDRVLDSFSFLAILDDRGRILIPAPIRKRMGLKFDSLVFVRIKTKILEDYLKEEGKIKLRRFA